MQSFARLMSAAPAASSSGLPRSTPAGNIGNFADGHGALDVAQREKAFGRGFFQRYLNNFPKQYQVAAGVATLTAAGVLLFATVSPGEQHRCTAAEKKQRSMQIEQEQGGVAERRGTTRKILFSIATCCSPCYALLLCFVRLLLWLFVLFAAKNAGAPNSKVRTPAWEKATEEYLKTQRVSPSHQRSG